MTYQLHSMLIVVTAITSPGLAQQPEVMVEVDRQEIYEGESVLYRVTLNYFGNPSPPKLEDFGDFKVTSLGEQSLNSSVTTIINGRATKIISRGQQYNYRLTPLKTGTFTIPAPVARIGNQLLKGRTVTLRVIAPQDQDTAILEITLSRQSVYPMQPFTVTLNVVIKDLPMKFSERNPLSVQRIHPTLQVPWFSDEQILTGLEPQKDWRGVLQPMLSQRGYGFQINNIGQSSVFSLFEREATVFQPTPSRTQRKDKSDQPAGYWEFAFTRKFIPRKVGTYEFGPVTIKGNFATAVELDRLVGENLYAVARPVTVTVHSVPAEGRPETFIGAVGQFEFASQLAPTKARVGDPMTLTLTLKGQGTLDEAFPPDLKMCPDIAVNFKMYDATTETTGNTRRFTYSLRPLKAGIDTFPAIPISYFDVGRERYVTVSSVAIPIEIRTAPGLSTDQIVVAPNSLSSPDRMLQVSEGGIFANDTDWRSLRNEKVHLQRWLFAWAGMFGFYVLATYIIGRVQRLKADPAMARRRAAATTARRALKIALVQLRNGHDESVCRNLRDVFANLVADVTNTSADGITSRDAKSRLLELDVVDDLAHATCDLVERCDAQRYGVRIDESEPLGSQAEILLEQLLECLKQKKVFR